MIRWKTVIVLSLFVISGDAASPDHDWSLEKMCNFHHGRYERRQSKNAGDVCKFEFRTSTFSKENAERFCNEYVPFPIVAVEHGTKTKCTAEAHVTCEPEWVQMYGRCYKITKKQMTYGEAKKHCAAHKNTNQKALGATIAFLHRTELVGRWNAFYRTVHRIWLDASEVYTEGLVYNEGPNMILAFNGFRYHVKNNALVRVPESETATVLCEYTPPMNKAASNYLIKRYDEIYYPSLQTEEGVYVRSASSRTRIGVRLADSEYCQGVLSPFLRSVGAQSAIPTSIFVKEIAKRDEEVVIIRTGVYSADAVTTSRKNAECTISHAKNYGMDIFSDDKNVKILFRKAEDVWRVDNPKELCDGASWSTSIVLGRPDAPGLEDMSDARSAPMYCQTRFESQRYGDCPAHYTPFNRPNGQKWCHRFDTKRQTLEAAVAMCALEGGFISGFTHNDEMALIDTVDNVNCKTSQAGPWHPDSSNVVLDLAGKTSVEFGNNQNIWLGARRREECNKYFDDNKGFQKDINSPCSRRRAFEWINGVAPNPPIFDDLWAPGEPNLMLVKNEREYCLVQLKGRVTWYNYIGDVKNVLNDVRCSSDEKHYTVCGQEAKIVLEALE